MYHYDPALALEELRDDTLLPNPVHLRDMIIRASLSPELALELNRQFLTYMEVFGQARSLAEAVLDTLSHTKQKL